MTTFDPWSALVGGALIGISASILLVYSGRTAGISGIVGGIFRARTSELGARLWFVVGLLLGGVVLRAVRPGVFGSSPVPLALVAGAGLLVGLGSRLGNGCTSGHGVCGLSRGSFRSLVATVVFMSTAAAATFVVGHIAGIVR